MSEKAIFVLTHPRACSTAFERVFMTRNDILQCVHEPFGDAYYYGPERLAERFADDEKARRDSGFDGSTYKTIMDEINRENKKEHRLFVKDMAQYFIPPNNRPPSMAPSLLDQSLVVPKRPARIRRASQIETTAPAKDAIKPPNDNDAKTGPPYPTPAEANNPTVVPTILLEQFHFAFLIRHPRNSIPSYYRCTEPPLDKLTGFTYFRPDEAGYGELRRMFDYLRAVGYIGPEIEGRDNQNGVNGAHTNGHATTNGKSAPKICVMDADDLLDHPNEVIETFCHNVGIDYSPSMLDWSDGDNAEVEKAFAKWKGFHEDAIHSNDLKPRQHKKAPKSDEQYYNEWVEKFGKDGADVIKQTVADCVPDYEYLRQFCIKV